MLDTVDGNGALFYTCVFERFERFVGVRGEFDDDPTIKLIEEKLDTNLETILQILHEDLGNRKRHA
jgi:hypothetical protein